MSPQARSFRPIRNAVLVKLLPEPPRMYGMLFLPDTSVDPGNSQRATPLHAEVLAVGRGRPIPQKHGYTGPAQYREMGVKPGDHVLLHRALEKSGWLERNRAIFGDDNVCLVPEDRISLVEHKPQVK